MRSGMCVWPYARCHMSGTQRTACGFLFFFFLLPSAFPGTNSSWLGRKYLYPLVHLTGPTDI